MCVHSAAPKAGGDSGTYLISLRVSGKLRLLEEIAVMNAGRNMYIERKVREGIYLGVPNINENESDNTYYARRYKFFIVGLFINVYSQNST